MKYVLFYEFADDAGSKVKTHYPAHRARFQDFHAGERLVMIGGFDGSLSEGAMAVFTTREAAEAFASRDPFVLHGVVCSWRIRVWNEVLAPPFGTGEPSLSMARATHSPAI